MIDLLLAENNLARFSWSVYFVDMRQDDVQLDQAVVEAAVEATLRGWGDELYSGQKFWWMDWNRLILDVLTALRTGEPVAIDDYYDDDDVRTTEAVGAAVEAAGPDFS